MLSSNEKPTATSGLEPGAVLQFLEGSDDGIHVGAMHASESPGARQTFAFGEISTQDAKDCLADQLFADGYPNCSLRSKSAWFLLYVIGWGLPVISLPLENASLPIA